MNRKRFFATRLLSLLLAGVLIASPSVTYAETVSEEIEAKEPVSGESLVEEDALGNNDLKEDEETIDVNGQETSEGFTTDGESDKDNLDSEDINDSETVTGTPEVDPAEKIPDNAAVEKNETNSVEVTEEETVVSEPKEYAVYSPGTGNVSIPANAYYYQGHYYQVYDPGIASYAKAEEYCEKLGGHLATLTTKDENDNVFSYICNKGYTSAYFGLSDEIAEDKWEWITGESSSFKNWAGGEPNNSGNEDYAMFYFKYSNGTWNDGNFGHGTEGNHTAFICEWDSGSLQTLLQDKSLSVYQNSYANNRLESKYYLASDVDVKVTTDSSVQSLKSDTEGCVKIDNITGTAIQDFAFQKKDYVKRVISWDKVKNTNKIYLQKSSNKFPVISGVWFNDTDIMNEAAEYSRTSKNATSVEVEVDWSSGQAKSLKLVQDSGTLHEVSLNTDGSPKSIVLNDAFDVSQPIFIEAEDENNVVTRRQLQNKVNRGSDLVSELKFGAPDGAEVKLAEDDGLFGGMSFSLDFDIIKNLDIPFTIASEDGKVYIALGMEPVGYSESSVDYKDGRRKDHIDEVKTVCSKVKRLKNGVAQKDQKKTKETLKDIFSKNWKEGSAKQISVGQSFSVNVVGFAEATLDENNQVTWLDGGLVVYGNYSNEKDWTHIFMLGAIPIPWYTMAKFEAELSARFNIIQSDLVSGYTDDLKVDTSFAVSGGIGAGVKKVLSAGGELKGSLEPHVTYNYGGAGSFWGDLALKLYARANLFGFEIKTDDLLEKLGIKLEKKDLWRVAIGQKTKKIAALSQSSADDNSVDSANAGTNEETIELTEEEVQSVMYALQQEFAEAVVTPEYYSAADLSYLEEESAFIANDAMNAVIAEDDISTQDIITNVYSYSSAKMVSLEDGTMIAVWMNSQDADLNHVQLYYSLQNPEDKTWTNPEPVQADGTPDALPVLMCDGNCAFVAWQNADSVLDYGTVDFTEIASHYDISAAVIRGDGTVESHTFALEGFDSMPSLAVSGGRASLVWTNNPANEVFVTGTNNNIMYAAFDGEVWSDAQAAYINLSSVESLSVDDVNNPRIVYCMSKTDEESGQEHNEIYENGQLLFGDGAKLSGVNFQNHTLYWYQNGSITSADQMMNLEEIPTDRYQIIENEKLGAKILLYLETSDAKTKLKAAFYNDKENTWNYPIDLLNGNEYIQDFSGTISENGVLNVLYNGVQVTYDSDENPVFGKGGIKKLSVPVFSNLSLTNLSSASDVNMYRPVINGVVQNRGMTDIKKFRVSVYKPEDEDTVIYQRDILTSIRPGEYLDFSVQFSDEAAASEKRFLVKVETIGPDQGTVSEDSDLTDNVKDISLKNENLKIQDLRWGRNADGSITILADIVNEGFTERANVSAAIYKQSLRGEPLDVVKLDSIRSFGLETVKFKLDENAGNVLYYVSIIENEDDFTEDDSDFVRIGDLRTNIDKMEELIQNDQTSADEIINALNAADKYDLLDTDEGNKDILSSVDKKLSEDPIKISDDITTYVKPGTGTSADNSVTDITTTGTAAAAADLLKKKAGTDTITGSASAYTLNLDLTLEKVKENVITMHIQTELASVDELLNECCDVSGEKHTPVSVSFKLPDDLKDKDIWFYKGTGKEITPEFNYEYNKETGVFTFITAGEIEYTISAVPLKKSDMEEKQEESGDGKPSGTSSDTNSGKKRTDSSASNLYAKLAALLSQLPSIGQTIIDGDGRYKILDKYTVEYVGPADRAVKTITIPGTISLPIVGSFKVVSIQKNAFKNCKKLKKVTIGKNIVKIGKNAFRNCKKLKKIIFKGKKLKSIGKKAFKGIAKNAKFKLPRNKKIQKKYKKLIKKAK